MTRLCESGQSLAHRSSRELVLNVEDLVDVEVALGQRSLGLKNKKTSSRAVDRNGAHNDGKTRTTTQRWPYLCHVDVSRIYFRGGSFLVEETHGAFR